MKFHIFPVFTALLLGSHPFTKAAAPAWWATHGVVNGSSASNLSPATVGQAKHMASKALEELRVRMRPSDYTALRVAVEAKVDLTLPVTQQDFDDQKRVLVNGQLKAMAKPFYDHIRTYDSAWLDTAMANASIRLAVPGSSPVTYSPYPWSVTQGDDANYSPAVLGQLKAVFSLKLETLTPDNRDTDGDGLPDTWEWRYGFIYDDASDAAGDLDGDGLSNLQESQAGTDPRLVDSDGDGVSDIIEVLTTFTDPLSASDGDSDGMADDWETWWATRILASGVVLTEPQIAALLLGHVEPGDDFLGNGTSNLEQSQVATTLVAGGATYRIQQKERAIWGNLMANRWGDACGIDGLLTGDVRYKGYDWADSCPPAGWLTPSASEIEGKLVEKAPWTSVDWDSVWTVYTQSNMHRETTASGGESYTYSQFLSEQHLVKLVFADISTEARKRSFIKATTTYGYPVAGIPVITYQTVNFTIAAGKTTSEAVEVDPGLVLGKEKKVTLVPTVVKINKTEEISDDLVAVSNGLDADLSTELSVQVGDFEPGTTAEFSMVDTDGGIKFEPATVTLVSGANTIKMWGTSPSSAKNSSKIKILIKSSSGETAIEKEVTVIDGIKLTFDGKFCSPIDARNERWRPGVTEYPNSPKNAPDDVINADSADHSSSISFTSGDQTQELRPSSPKSSVKVTKVEAVSPPMELGDDPLKGADLHMISGKFEHNHGASEKIENPVIHFKTANGSLFSIEISNRSDDTRIAPDGTVATVPVAQKINAAALAGDKLALWLQAAPPYNVVYVPNAGNTPHSDQRDHLENTLSKLRFKWENSKFKSIKQSNIGKSVAAKAAVGADQKRGPAKTKLEFKLDSWDGWELSGKVNAGKFTSP